MLEGVDFESICKQYVLQIGLLFLTEIQMKIQSSGSRADDNAILDELADFREGFDQRLKLIVINHMLRKYYLSRN